MKQKKISNASIYLYPCDLINSLSEPACFYDHGQLVFLKVQIEINNIVPAIMATILI